ncbi:MAG: ECF transporter S component [Oscillospiraceae bacterium]|nr:ECF transporter S component [Oscillospiraceae bacterium]
MSNSTTITKQSLSVKKQTLASVITVIMAVALPQIIHVMGHVSGLGTSLGEIFLPMHLPIILAGLIAGPYVGAISGMLSPLLSFALTGMPTSIMLPFMMIELCAYGLISGLLKNSKLPCIAKVLTAQIGGRVLRAVSIFTAVYAFGHETLSLDIILTSITTGIFGIVLQWLLIPLVTYRLENKNEK